MRARPTLLLAALLLCLGLPAPASAARGDGPYTPFPEEDPTARALDFVQRLNSSRPEAPRDLTPEELERGVVLRPRGERGRSRRDSPGNTSEGGTPFQQAGVAPAGDPPSPASWPFVLAAVLLASAGGALALRARP